MSSFRAIKRAIARKRARLRRQITKAKTRHSPHAKVKRLRDGLAMLAAAEACFKRQPLSWGDARAVRQHAERIERLERTRQAITQPRLVWPFDGDEHS